MQSSVGALEPEHGAIQQLGLKYFEDLYFARIGSDEYRDVLRAMAGGTGNVSVSKDVTWVAIALACLLQLAVGTYGGYFGAGIGFVMLGMMTLLGMREIHVMNALRIALAAVINGVAVVTFIVSGAVFWGQCLVMMAGALSGGWFGAQYAQKADPKKVRWFIIALGLGLSAYFFVRAR